jgi:transcription initiation factor IIE alpha subunit
VHIAEPKLLLYLQMNRIVLIKQTQKQKRKIYVYTYIFFRDHQNNKIMNEH